MKTELSNVKEELAICAVRGTEHPRSDMIETHDGRLICQDEFDDNWFTSDDSGRVFPDETMEFAGADADRRIDHSELSAYRTCNHYDNFMPIAEGGARVNGHWISQHALENSGIYFSCAQCGMWTHIDDECERDGESLCEGCTDAYDEAANEDEDEAAPDESVITDYGNRRYPPCLGKGPLFSGVELEVEVLGDYDVTERGRATQAVLNARHPFVILKGDGSLNRGFEIVTAPATFDMQRVHWAPFFDNLPKGLRSWDTTTCGMHVHISRDALSSLQLGKMLVFANRAENKQFMTAMAGRNPERWAAFKEKKLSDGMKNDSNRYSAINTCGSETVEFRIFKGTLNRTRFFANLEFVEALVAFTSTAERSIDDSADSAAFSKWVSIERRHYPNLYARLIAKGYLTRPVVSARSKEPSQPLVETATDVNT